MADVPSSKNRAIVEALRHWCDALAHNPSLCQDFNLYDHERDAAALTRYVIAGASDISHIECGVARASKKHYKRLAQEIIAFLWLHPDNAVDDLADVLQYIELAAHARTNEFKKRQAAH